MCFSASLSFGASALLGGTGIVTLKKASSPRMIAFASVPLLFGIHQLTEGFVWLSMDNPEFANWQRPSMYGYLILSQVVWPTWTPLAIWLMEPEPRRKKLLLYFVVLGMIMSAFMTYTLLTVDASVAIGHHHIRYEVEFLLPYVRHLLYFLTVIVPIFISSIRYIKLFGAVLFASLVLSFIFFKLYVLSVWCFFAALLSVMILYIVLKNRQTIDTEIHSEIMPEKLA